MPVLYAFGALLIMHEQEWLAFLAACVAGAHGGDRGCDDIASYRYVIFRLRGEHRVAFFLDRARHGCTGGSAV